MRVVVLIPETLHAALLSWAAKRPNSGSRLDFGWPLVNGCHGIRSVAATRSYFRRSFSTMLPSQGEQMRHVLQKPCVVIVKPNGNFLGLRVHHDCKILGRVHAGGLSSRS